MLDLSKNTIPEKIDRIHITAVCGTAMGALACMLKEAGYKVTGSDQNVYPPMSDFLTQKGVDIIKGFARKNLETRPDLVIIGNSVRKDNPEALAAEEYGLNFCSLPQALNHFFAPDRTVVLVSGTHGKTTTSSLLAWVLFQAGFDPSFMIGGILKDFNSNYRLGNGKLIVIEGDEYDTAFFDKGAKFYHFKADITILTGIEFDHADIFSDLEHVKNVFEKFIAQHEKKSLLIAADSDKEIDAVTEGKNLTIKRYGFSEGSDWQIEAFRTENMQSVFNLFKEGCFFGEISSSLPGRHNAMNILSVAAAADSLGIPSDRIKEAIASFKGVKRRQEVRGVKSGITVIDDFAHHPTAVKETVRAVKSFYGKNRLVAVFEPRTNSSRRNVFQGDYPGAFDDADIVLVRDVSMLNGIPESDRFSSRKLVEDLKDRKKEALFFPTTEEIIRWVKKSAQKEDVILVMSNGGFDNIHERILESL